MRITDISKVITERNIVVFSPHYDDFPLFLAGYVFELEEKGLLETKKFTNINVFSRTNYQLRQIEGNKDLSLERIKFAVGNRMIEDISCMDELFGRYNYTYRLLCEYDCSLREKKTADSEMEFHHGVYDDFDNDDWSILKRLIEVVKQYSQQEDTALLFPIGFKEHIDHFIVREAGLSVAKERNNIASFYFAEEKPLSGIANEAEIKRIDDLIQENKLNARAFRHHPERMIDIVFRHYISQVEEVYSKGIATRAAKLSSLYSVDFPVDCIYAYPKNT